MLNKASAGVRPDRRVEGRTPRSRRPPGGFYDPRADVKPIKTLMHDINNTWLSIIRPVHAGRDSDDPEQAGVRNEQIHGSH